MSDRSLIEWTDSTWNPWYGCTKVSPACASCYAERQMRQYGRNFDVVTRAKPATFNKPVKCQREAVATGGRLAFVAH